MLNESPNFLRTMRGVLSQKVGPQGRGVKLDAAQPPKSPKKAIPLPGAAKPLKWPSVNPAKK